MSPETNNKMLILGIRVFYFNKQRTMCDGSALLLRVMYDLWVELELERGRSQHESFQWWEKALGQPWVICLREYALFVRLQNSDKTARYGWCDEQRSSQDGYGSCPQLFLTHFNILPSSNQGLMWPFVK